MNRRSILKSVSGALALAAGHRVAVAVPEVPSQQISWMYRAIALMRRMCVDQTMCRVFYALQRQLQCGYEPCHMSSPDELNSLLCTRRDMTTFYLRNNVIQVPVELQRIADSLGHLSNEELVQDLSWDERRRIGAEIMEWSLRKFMIYEMKIGDGGPRKGTEMVGGCRVGPDDIAFKVSDDGVSGVEALLRRLEKVKGYLLEDARKHTVVYGEVESYETGEMWIRSYGVRNPAVESFRSRETKVGAV